MTKLLVSVRNDSEALEALSGGADIIDVKEPRNGSLGAATPSMWFAVRNVVHTAGSDSAAVGRRIMLSAALGELVEYRSPLSFDDLTGYTYAKVGLAGCMFVKDWREKWHGWAAELPFPTTPVAVTYADYRQAMSPTPFQVMAVAAEAGVRMLLIDTHDKTGGNVFAQMPPDELQVVIARARELGLQIALAGSLTLDTLDAALRAAPDVIAVRGAVCRGRRDAVLDRELVKRFVERLSTPNNVDEQPDSAPPIDAITTRA